MDLPSAIRQLAAGRDLSRQEMQDVMSLIMHGEATPAQIGAFLTALMIKGETVEEIVGAATIMRELAARVEPAAERIVDTVGTGDSWTDGMAGTHAARTGTAGDDDAGEVVAVLQTLCPLC